VPWMETSLERMEQIIEVPAPTTTKQSRALGTTVGGTVVLGSPPQKSKTRNHVHWDFTMSETCKEIDIDKGGLRTALGGHILLLSSTKMMKKTEN
jgi:hypothetical protein